MTFDKEKLEALRIQRDENDDRDSGRSGWWVAAVAIVAAGLLGAWWLLGSRQPIEVSAVIAGQPASAGGAAQSVLNASGYVVARRLATVSSKVTGKILEVLVEEGATVSEGEVLARLDDSTVKAQLALAENQLAAARDRLSEIRVRLEEARRTLARNRTLRADNLVSASVLDTSEADVAALAARLEASQSDVGVAASNIALIRQELDDLVIRAPFSGVVISKNAQPGEMISPISAGGGFTRTGICTIVDMGSREIEVDVNESFINRVTAGQPVDAVLDAYPDWTIPARVINIVPAADRNRATVKVRIAFDRLDPRMLPDMGIKVRFLDDSTETAPEGVEAVASLPDTSVFSENGRYYVWLIDQGKLEKRAIRVAGPRNGQYDVLAGLLPGQRVVARPGAGLAPGAVIEVRPEGG